MSVSKCTTSRRVERIEKRPNTNVGNDNSDGEKLQNGAAIQEGEH